MRKWTMILIMMILFGYGGCVARERSHFLTLAPCGMELSGIAYGKTETWGGSLLGLPGDSETGVIVYYLPESTVTAVEAQGVVYLEGLRCTRQLPRHRGHFTNWLPTPVAPDSRWADQVTTAGFLNRYGFGIPIRTDIEAMIDKAISTPGALYAYSGSGFMLVVPRERRAVYMYAG
jgi:hypothetical protein